MFLGYKSSVCHAKSTNYWFTAHVTSTFICKDVLRTCFTFGRKRHWKLNYNILSYICASQIHFFLRTLSCFSCHWPNIPYSSKEICDDGRFLSVFSAWKIAYTHNKQIKSQKANHSEKYVLFICCQLFYNLECLIWLTNEKLLVPLWYLRYNIGISQITSAWSTLGYRKLKGCFWCPSGGFYVDWKTFYRNQGIMKFEKYVFKKPLLHPGFVKVTNTNVFRLCRLSLLQCFGFF